MQKRKKARVISTAMAAVVLIGVCSDFRLSFTGDKNAAQENILDIAATGAITYASESGGAIGKSCLVSAMIEGSNLMRGVSMGGGEPLYASLFAMQEGANDIGEQFGGILDTTLDNITGRAVEGNQLGETDNVNRVRRTVQIRKMANYQMRQIMQIRKMANYQMGRTIKIQRMDRTRL